MQNKMSVSFIIVYCYSIYLITVSGFAILHYMSCTGHMILGRAAKPVLCLIRLVHSGPDRGSPQPGGELSFATRTGTRLGIETHIFRAETCKDLSLWTRHIVTGCHTAAEMIKEVTTSKHSPEGRRNLSVLLLLEAKVLKSPF